MEEHLMAVPLAMDNAYYNALLGLHSMRHPRRSTERNANEVKDFLRRAFGLDPDCRKAIDGGLAGLTNVNARDAFFLARASQEDITTLYRDAR
jgi:hypothetical protein